METRKESCWQRQSIY